MISAAILLLGCLGCSDSPSSGGPARSAPASSLSLMPPGPSTPTGTVEERVEKAQALAASGDLPAAIDTLEEGLRIDSKDRTSLRLLSRYLKDRAKAVESEGTTEYYTRLVSAAEYFRRLRELYPDQTDEEKTLGLELFYDEATAHAKSLRIEETTGSLRDLVGAGFHDFDRIRKDPAWEKILALPEFREEFDTISGATKAP
jgi:tetratricopeptide (TPR) repeat protein